ncbi:hypothetical protein AMTR_s00012p00262610 [Amborella trichopoda]|uniref:Uncharacterized protein n=1 Tax=Amborella trichopoda TaxID=13333 RepID=W1PK60_AMBTC|nr:hypothetical protein AMTR_s00012p00262610 [Amborella trichopoda]
MSGRTSNGELSAKGPGVETALAEGLITVVTTCSGTAIGPDDQNALKRKTRVTPLSTTVPVVSSGSPKGPLKTRSGVSQSLSSSSRFT